MLLFIANVSVKRVSCLLLLLMLLWSLAECVWQIDCPLWLSELFFFFLLLRPNAGAFSVPLTFAWWVRTASNAQDSFEFFPFRSVNHHYLSEGACLPPTPPPRRKPESWFFFSSHDCFFSFRSLCHCCVRTRGWRARRRPTRVCARPPVYTHLRKGEREQRKKTFGKLIAGKKEMISRKKRVYNHHDGEEGRKRTARPRVEDGKKSIALCSCPYTNDEYTNIFKKRNM